MPRIAVSWIVSVPFLLAAAGAVADDWPQWAGPHRDSVWRETGVVKEFPQDGLPIVWRSPVGLGYAGPAVAAGRAFVMDYSPSEGEVSNNPTARARLQGKERVLCFSAKDGKPLWQHEYDCGAYEISYPSGPRCTPTVVGDRVYTLGAQGRLSCLDAADGRVVWAKELTEEYKTKTPIWGYASHPLVAGDLLISLVGGEGSVAVAFDKQTGREVWRALSGADPGYCPPTLIEHAGVQQLLIWTPESVNSLDPQTGKVHWSLPLAPNYGMSIAAPRKLGDKLFVSGIGQVGGLIQLGDDGRSADFVWKGTPKTALYSANSTPLLVDDMIYGMDCQAGSLVAAKMETGERLWETFDPVGAKRRVGHGTAFLVRHEKRFFLFSEQGDLILADLSPAGYVERGKFHVLEPTNEAFGRKVVWSHPAFADRCLFARNDRELVCVDLAEKR